MSIFQKFEDIIAWQKARVLCQVIKKYTDKELFSKDFKLVSQIKASSGSAISKKVNLKEINLKANKNRLMRNVIMGITTLNTELKTQNYN